MSGVALDQKRKGLAVASFVVGLLSLATLGLLVVGSVVGLVIARIALKRIRGQPGRSGGKGFAIAGLITNAMSLLLLAAAIVLPCPLMAKVAVNESSAFSSLLVVHKAEADFRSRSGRYGSLGELADAGVVESDLACGSKDGYRFEVVAKSDSFEATATPLIYRDRMWRLKGTGKRSFYVSELGVMHESDKKGDKANADDPPIE